MRKITISMEGLALYRSRDNQQAVEEGVKKSPVVKKPDEILDNYNYVFGEIVRILALALVIIGLQLILHLGNITF